MTLTAVPPEIIEHVVRFFSHDKESLNTCSSVSIPFLYACRRQLFRVITLFADFNTAPRVCERLANVLSSHPELVYYIQELRLFTRNYFTELATSLPTLLYSIASANSLKILHISINHGRILWSGEDNPHKLWQNAFLSLLQSEALHTLVAETDSDDSALPVDLVAASPSLRNLTLRVFYSNYSGYRGADTARLLLPHNVSYSSQGYLDSLRLYGQGTRKFIDYLTSSQCPTKLSNLRELSIDSMGWENEQIAWDVMKTAAETLEYLHISNRNSCNDDFEVGVYGNLQLATLCSLRFIEFRLFPVLIHDAWIVDAMQSWGMPRSIETIRICFGSYQQRGHAWYSLEQISMCMDQHAGFDGTFTSLCNKQKYPHLKNFEIFVFITNYAEHDAEQRESCMRKWFPRLHETGYLHGRILDAYVYPDKDLAWN